MPVHWFLGRSTMVRLGPPTAPRSISLLYWFRSYLPTKEMPGSTRPSATSASAPLSRRFAPASRVAGFRSRAPAANTSSLCSAIDARGCKASTTATSARQRSDRLGRLNMSAAPASAADVPTKDQSEPGERVRCQDVEPPVDVIDTLDIDIADRDRPDPDGIPMAAGRAGRANFQS